MTTPSGAPDREREIARLVGARASSLQQALDGGSTHAQSAARADLARLRRLRPGDLGGDTDSWALTMDVLPAGLLGHTDGPNAAEQATQSALVLFATHAQSSAGAVHVRNQSLGFAIRQLAEARDSDEPTAGPVMARFQTLGRAQTYSQLMTHLRGIVQLLRAEGIPLDYGMLAADLYRWLQPAGVPIVRLRWGRGFHRISMNATPTKTTTDTPNESETTHVR